MFSVLRISVLVLFLLIAYAFRKMLFSNTKRGIASAIVMVLGYLTIAMSPFENIFYSFNTPIQAFEYSTGYQSIIKVVETSNSAFILYGNAASQTIANVPRNGAGWGIGGEILGPHVVFQNIYDNHIIAIFADTSMKYEMVLVMDGSRPSSIDDIHVSDSRGSKFDSIVLKYGEPDVYTIDHYTVCDYLVGDYSIIINGNVYKIQ